MSYKGIVLCLIVFSFSLSGCKQDETDPGSLELLNAFSGTTELNLSGSSTADIPTDATFTLIFSAPVDRSSATNSIMLRNGSQVISTSISFLSSDKAVVIQPAGVLSISTLYTIQITDQLRGSTGAQFPSAEFSFKTTAGSLQMTSFKIGDQLITNNNRVQNVSRTPAIELIFSVPLNPQTVSSSVIRITGKTSVTPVLTLQDENKKLVITTPGTLSSLARYQVAITNALKGAEGQSFAGLSKDFYTVVDPAPKRPLLPNDEDNDNDNTNDLLSVVQQQTFKYFWDFAHPASGMARERNTSGNIVTSGGSGFGIMTLIVGMERNFITRAQGLERMDKILDFLETADRFHGAWSHWIDGNTGDVVPFSPNDNGGDLVETAFLVEGLITFRQYLNGAVPAEQSLIDRINVLWKGVEWDWYRQSNQSVLYWHWSSDKGWAMNHQIKGWNECLITYVLAASADADNTIPKSVYETGWASGGGLRNGNTYEGVTLPLGFEYGGPLFFTHYSFLGLDPRTLSDQYANYWTQNVNHSQINYKYSVRNPRQFVGYSDACWGLTASDNHQGYSAHSPTNDLGVISPTAALSSFPYTPQESMRALKFFYYTLGDKTWGQYGFYDAFNVTEDWYANSYLAIDQGPIVVMIENYRTGLLWNLFMSAPEINTGLTKLGFTH